MLILKIYYHIMCTIKKVFYKIIYGKKIKFGRKVHFRKGFSLMIEEGANVEIGDGTFFNNHCSINAQDFIKIGKNCLFGENVKIYDHNHVFKYRDKLIKEQGFKSDKVVIKDNCWVGSNVVILKGTSIGANSVIGACEKINTAIEENKICIDSKISDIRME